MKKKISMLLCLIAAASFTLTSCNAAHEHTFSDKWTSDATNHWHAATCEHGEEKDGLAKHADANEDGKCDVCDYEVGHKHTYATTWSKDATHHWKAATCTHTGEVSEKALHADIDADYECDECDAHVHILNSLGACTDPDCGEQVKPMDETNLEMVVAKVGTKYNCVVSGEINYAFDSVIHSEVDENGNKGYTKSNSKVEYTLGNGATYVKRADTNTTYATEDSYSDTMSLRTISALYERWYYTDTEDTENPIKLLEAYTDNDGVVTPANLSASVEDLYGYWYVLPNFVDGYGAENFLAGLYEASQAETASMFVFNHNATANLYKFSFTSTLIESTDQSDGSVVHNVALFDVEVEFTYSDDYVLTGLKVKVDSYTNDAGQNSQTDNSLTYDPTTGVVSKIDGITAPTYTFNVTQVAGTRNYVHTKTLDDLTPTAEDFTFSIDGTAVSSGATLNYSPDEIVEEGEYYDTEGVLFIDINCPEGMYFDLAYGNLVNNNFSATTVDSPAIAMVYKAGYVRISNLLYNMSYDLTVKYLDTTIFTATITITDGMDIPAAPTEGEYITVKTTDFECFSDKVTFTAEKAGDYTFTFPVGYGIQTQEQYDDYFSWPQPMTVDPEVGGTYTVSLAAGESTEFYLWSPKPHKFNHYISYTYTSNITGDGSEETPFVVAGYGQTSIAANYFMPTFVTVKAGETASLDCAAKFYTDPMDLESAVGTSVTPVVDTTYAIFADNMSGCTGLLIGGKVVEVEDETTSSVKDANGLGGNYTVNFVIDNAYTIVITPNSEGASMGTIEVTDNINNGQNSGTYTYLIDNGSYIFMKDGSVTTNLILSLAMDGTTWQIQCPGMAMAQTLDAA